MTTSPDTPKLVLENMLEVLEYERKRISLNLHDSVQNKLRMLRDEIQIPEQRHQLDAILDELRTIAYNLVPKSLQEFSLKEYLLIYTATLNKTYKGKFHVDYRGNVQIEVPKDIETELFNIVQECMTNIIKYADTPVVLIRYNQLPDALELIVQDVGSGFDLEEAMQKNSIGLKSIYSRTEFIGGTCDIKTAPDGSGASVKITIPIQESWKEQEGKTIFDEDIEKKLQHGVENRPGYSNNETISPSIFLFVDNQPEITAGLIQIFAKEWKSATFLTATSAEDAIAYLETIVVDVLITDISMPDKSGLILLEQVAAKHQNIKTFIYSINDNPAYVYKAIHKLSVNGYVWKEDTLSLEDRHQLIQAVKQVIATNEAFYSRQIEETKSYLDIKSHNVDVKQDEKNRELLKQYALVLKELRNENWVALHALITEIKGNQETIKTEMEKIEADAKTKSEYFTNNKWTEKGEKYKKRQKDNLIKELKLQTSLPIAIADRVAKELQLNVKTNSPSATIDRYFRSAKESYQIDDDWQLFQLVIRIAEDFGLISEISGKS